AVVVLSLAGGASLLAGSPLALLLVLVLVWLVTLFLFLKPQSQLRDAEQATNQAKGGRRSLGLRERVILGALLGALPGALLGPRFLCVALWGHLPATAVAVHSLPNGALGLGMLAGVVCGVCAGIMAAYF